MKRKKKILSVVLGMAMAVLLLPATVLAAGSVDTGKNCHLTISYQDGEKALIGAPFDIYRVAAVEETGELTPAAPFEQYNVNIRGKNDSAWKTLASTLEGYVLRDKITPYDSGETDEQGILGFPNQKKKLETGLYLVLGERHTQDGMIYDAEPFMIMLPTIDKEANDWLYDMTVNPKHESEPEPVETVSRRVLKVWEDNGNEKNRPKEITVQLLKDGEVFDTVTLNADNNWRYTWEELDGNAKWTVAEKEVEGYEVSVVREGVTFIITNSYIEPPVTPPPDETLVQTGQLWWPVPLLVAGGLLFIAFGLICRRNERNER